MTVSADTHPTLVDVLKVMTEAGDVLPVAEVLAETNDILMDVPFFEGNLPTGHKGAIRTGYPVPTWRKLYGGVQPTKADRETVVDSCGMMEAYCEIDKALADLAGNKASFLADENRAHIIGMSEEFVDTLIYGDSTVNPEQFMGLAARFGSSTGGTGDNVIIDGTVDGADNASIWLVCWGKDSIFGIYPKGSKAGLQARDMGEVTIEDTTGSGGGRMQAYRMHYRWDCGLHVKDWRYIVRINYNDENLVHNAATGPVLISLMIQATQRVPRFAGTRPVFYANRKAQTFLIQQMRAEVANSTLTMANQGGIPELTFMGIPVRRVDALNRTETGLT